MQLSLSSLVDLALGNTHYLGCENLTLLHSVLQVLLKKTDLSDTQLELTDDLAVRATNMINTLPDDEPSILFKEYKIRNNGTKVRKRNSLEVHEKRSLIQIKRRWPRCCPSTADKANPSLATSLVSIQKVDELKALTDRVESLEKEIETYNQQAKMQMKENCLALKSEFSEIKPVLNQLQSSRESSNLDFFNQISSKNIEVKVNIHEAPEGYSSCGEVTTPHDRESQNYDSENISEITLIKQRIGDIKKTLSIHGKVLKRLKSVDLKKIPHDDQSRESKDQNTIKAVKCRDISILRRDIQQIKLQRDLVAAEMKAAKEEIYDRLHSLKVDMESRINEKNRSLAMPNDSSEYICTKNLQHERNDSSSDERFPTEANLLTNEQNRNQKSLKLSLNHTINQSSLRQFASNASSLEVPRCTKEPNSNISTNYEDNCSTQNMQANPSDGCIKTIKRQLNSLRHCYQQLAQELACKVDRCEFAMCRSQENETFDISTAAGVSIPLMRNINCISCKTTTNMKILADRNVAKMPSLRYGRVSSNAASDFNTRSQCRSISDRNWNSFSQSIGRRAGGSHTKVSKAMQVKKMRYNRLKTPLKVVSSFFICKNRFRKSN